MRKKTTFPIRDERAKNPLPGIPLDKEVIKQLILKYRGNLTKVALALKCARQTVRKICNVNPDVQEILEEARERILDEVEDNFLDRVLKGDTTSAIFFLKTRGRERGYDQDFRADIESVTRAALDFALNKSMNPAEVREKRVIIPMKNTEIPHDIH